MTLLALELNSEGLGKAPNIPGGTELVGVDGRVDDGLAFVEVVMFAGTDEASTREAPEPGILDSDMVGEGIESGVGVGSALQNGAWMNRGETWLSPVRPGESVVAAAAALEDPLPPPCFVLLLFPPLLLLDTNATGDTARRL